MRAYFPSKQQYTDMESSLLLAITVSPLTEKSTHVILSLFSRNTLATRIELRTSVVSFIATDVIINNRIFINDKNLVCIHVITNTIVIMFNVVTCIVVSIKHKMNVSVCVSVVHEKDVLLDSHHDRGGNSDHS